MFAVFSRTNRENFALFYIRLAIRDVCQNFPRTRPSFLMIGRQRQNRISAPASFAALSFKVLLLSSMCATASFCFRKFSEVFSIWITCRSTQQECGKNVLGRRPLFFPLYEFIEGSQRALHSQPFSGACASNHYDMRLGCLLGRQVIPGVASLYDATFLFSVPFRLFYFVVVIRC